MSIYVPKFTADKLPASKTWYGVGSDSSARKFTSDGIVQNNDPTDSTSNSEHIVMAAAGAGALSSAVQAIAAEAREQVAIAIVELLQSSADIDPLIRAKMFQYTDEDISTMQQALAVRATSRYNRDLENGVSSALGAMTKDFIVASSNAFIPKKAEDANKQTLNTAVPQIENVLVDLDPRKGATDSFYVGITFNIDVSKMINTKLIRIFRSEVQDPVYTRPLASLSSIGVQKISSARGKKNNDNINMSVNRLNENDVQNAISKLGMPNPFTSLKMSASPDGSLIIPPPLPGQKIIQNDDPNVPEAFHHLDRSVIENINVLFNLQSNPVFGFHVSPVTSSIGVGNNIGNDDRMGDAQRVEQTNNVSDSVLVIDSDNKLMFREISHFSPDAIFSQQVGEIYEFFFADDSVTYGGGYKYFIVTVNDQMVQSARSTVVDAVVEAMRVPARPTLVNATADQKTVTLSMIVDDQLVEKFEIHRIDSSPSRKSQVIAEVISGQAGFSIAPMISDIAQNNFILIGEALNSSRSGATFIDTDVSPGHPYIYRVYSVDIFGNKSESPFEISAYISDRQDQFVPLKAPSLLTEIDAKTKRIRITFSSNEPLIQRMRLERRDMTTGEIEFSAPGTSARTILGNGRSPLKNRNSLQGEILSNKDPAESWTGFFQNTGAQQVFVDSTVQFDHVYQYRIFGEDRYGNRSSYRISSALLVNRRPVINVPANFKSTLIWDATFKIQGVQLNWERGSLDVSAADMLGNQSVLADSSTRALYQVQRRMEGEEVWENFPLTSAIAMLDSVEGVAGDVAPNFRPSYPKLNQMYHYRVQAIQIGNYISNFTEPQTTFIGFNVSDPESFVLRTPSVYLRPFFVMLNWDTPTMSGIVDRWDIERCSVNNFAAAKFNINSPDSYALLTYVPFRSVYRESSRFSGRETDSSIDITSFNTDIISGEHYYMDTQVDFGNSYFYRIRAVDSNGNTSGWVYKGMRLTSQVYEQKWTPLYTDEEKKLLALSLQPQLLVRAVRKNTQSSMGLLPGYSTPDSARTTPRISYEIVKNSG